VAEDVNGRLWGGTWGYGAFVRRGDRFEPVPGLDFNLSVLALLHLREDEFFAGTSAGLLHFQAGKTSWITQAGKFGSPDVRAVVKDQEGRVWFGMLGGGLGCLKDGQLKQFRKADGLSSDFIQCLRADDDGSLWIGTFGGGLTRLKHGKFSAIGEKQGLPNNVICDIEEDAQGFFWMSSQAGIMRASKAELNRCADGLCREVAVRSYDMNDGLPTVQCSGGLQPAGCKTSDGRLWFPTAKGLVAIDPENVKTNQLPPPVVIEEATIDDRVAFDGADDSRPMVIPPGSHRIEFRYTGLSLVAAEKVRFKYRLNGWDKEWINAGTRRVAHYAYIPPGNYAFQVIACNNDAVWNETGAQIAFAALPYFWQTVWFRILSGAATLAAGGGIVWLDARRRMRRKLERLERQRSLEQERTRIANDIHDDLGVQLTRIGMLSDPARIALQGSEQASADLNRIYTATHELTRAMDEIVWAVNPHHDTFESLVNYLHKFAQDFLEAADLRCRLDMPIQLPSWPLSAEVRHNLFLAFKETLNNVVKHANATEVRISLALETAAFTLAIEDNGRGFVLENTEDGIISLPAQQGRGNGLRNMKHRLAEINGCCEITSVPGRGTQVTFVLPVKLDSSGPGPAGGHADEPVTLNPPPS
jgi:signal transduction histidine kinase